MVSWIIFIIDFHTIILFLRFIFILKPFFFPNFPGGLSPDLQSMEQIRRIMRPTDVPDQGLLCDLLWSDPDKVCYTYFKFQISKEAFNPLWDIADCVIF